MHHAPHTCLAGLVDKAAEALVNDAPTANEFACPPRLMDMVGADAAAGAIPVCLLYSTDTVGGNSGSPVLNAAGEFVAINFDRQRHGLMNEFKWSAAFSRSIGVDVVCAAGAVERIVRSAICVDICTGARERRWR